MAQIIQPDTEFSQDQTQISDRYQFSGLAMSYEREAQVSDELGKGIENTSLGNDMRNIGDAAAKASEMHMATMKNSIDSSIVMNKLNSANLEFNQAIENRSNKIIDDKGNPTFTNLTSDVGQIGQNILNKYLGDITDPKVRDAFSTHFQSAVANSQLRSLQTAVSQQAMFSAASYNQFKNTLSQQAAADPIDALPVHLNQLQEFLGQRVASGEMKVDVAQNELASFEKDARLGHAYQSIQSDPNAFMKVLQNDPNSLKLQPDDVRLLTSQTQSAINQRTAATETTKRAMIQQYGYLFKEAQDLQVQGKEIPNQLSQYIQKVSTGTPLESAANQMLTQQTEVSKFANMDPLERSQYLDHLEKNPNLDPNLGDIHSLLSEVNDHINTAIKSDPVGFYDQKGQLPPTSPLDLTQPLASQILDRQTRAAYVQAKTGLQTDGLTANEQAQTLSYINNLPPMQAAAQLASLKSTLNPNTVSSLMTGLKKQDQNSLLPVAGSFVNDGHPEIAQMILNGKEAIDSKTTAIKDRSAVINLILGSSSLPAYNNPQQRADIINAVYAGIAGTATSAPTQDDVDKVVKQVANGGAVDFNGAPVEPFKYGQTAQQFHANISQITPEMVDKLGGISNLPQGQAPADVIGSSQLRNEGRGVYSVWPQGMGQPAFLKDNNGKIFLLDFNKLAEKPVFSVDAFQNADKAPAVEPGNSVSAFANADVPIQNIPPDKGAQ